MIESVSQTLQNAFAHISTLSGALQLFILAIAAIMAFLSHRSWLRMLQNRLGDAESKGVIRAAIRGTGRIVFPISMVFFLIIGRGILAQFDLSTPILKIVTSLLLSLAAIRFLVYTLRRAYTPSSALKAWEGIISGLIWVVVALYLVGWLPDIAAAMDQAAITFGDTRISVLSVMQLVIAISFFAVAAGWLANIIERKAKRSKYLSPSMKVGLTKFSKFFLYTLAILIALNSVGIDLTSLTVFGGALGVGLGFGLQRIASNFISGFILLFDRSIRPGDVISVGDRFGWVQALHARYVVVRDRDGVETLIPNENLITSEVINWSYSDKQIRLRLPVQISYADDPEQAMQILLDACSINSRILSDPEPQARLTSFADNGIQLELRLWLDDPQEGISNVKSDVFLEIWRQFKNHAITIPFPQRDVRMIKS